MKFNMILYYFLLVLVASFILGEAYSASTSRRFRKKEKYCREITECNKNDDCLKCQYANKCEVFCCIPKGAACDSLYYEATKKEECCLGSICKPNRGDKEGTCLGLWGTACSMGNECLHGACELTPKELRLSKEENRLENVIGEEQEKLSKIKNKIEKLKEDLKEAISYNKKGINQNISKKEELLKIKNEKIEKLKLALTDEGKTCCLGEGKECISEVIDKKEVANECKFCCYGWKLEGTKEICCSFKDEGCN